MKQFIEGSHAVAEIVKRCRPGVVSAYPITPQTHIVEDLAQMVADKELNAQFVNVESEHSAASVVLGAEATGVRSYTATSSQGLWKRWERTYRVGEKETELRCPLSAGAGNVRSAPPATIKSVITSFSPGSRTGGPLPSAWQSSGRISTSWSCHRKLIL